MKIYPLQAYSGEKSDISKAASSYDLDFSHDQYVRKRVYSYIRAFEELALRLAPSEAHKIIAMKEFRITRKNYEDRLVAEDEKYIIEIIKGNKGIKN